MEIKAAEKVSVIVPAFNSEKTIRACIEGVLGCGYDGPYEVIAVDDGSTDGTARAVSGYSGVRLLRQENAGPAAARNSGARAAAGEILLFTDADCVPTKGWISEMLRPFAEEPDVVGVKGIYRTRQRGLTARFVQAEYEDKYAYMKRSRYIDFVDTYSAAFRRDVFLDAGGYDTSFPVACAEDVDFSYRLSQKGLKMVFSPGAAVYHTHPDGPWAYMKKKYKFAFWRVFALRKNPGKAVKDSHTPQAMKAQLLVPPALLGCLALGAASQSYVYPLSITALFFLATSAPFSLRALRRDIHVGLVSPAFLLLRAAAQFAGVCGGIVYSFRKKVS